MLSLFLSFNAVASYTEENNYPECKPSRNYEIVDSKIIKTDDFEEEDVPDLSQLGPYTVEVYLDIICQDNIAYYDDGYGLLDDEGEALYQTTVSGYRAMHLKVTTPSDNFPFYVLRDYSGGMHCCFNNFFLSKDKPYRIVQELFSYDSKLKYSDLDGDGALEIMLHDSIFSYWKTCYACSRSIKVIYRVNEEGLHIAQDLMRQEMQHPTVESALKKIRKELAKVKPESDMGISMGFNQRLHDIGVFTARFLYAGMREEAWQFFDQIWNEQEKYLDISKLDFEIELLEQVFGSKHYQLLAAKNPITSPGWIHEGRVLPPSVFKKQWVSSDNFEKFEEHFKIETKDCWTIEEYGVTFCRSEDFRNNPGKYFGKEIKDLDPIKAWDGYISLAVSLDAINFNQPHQIKDHGYGEGIFQKIDGVEMFYKIIGEVNTEHCMELAPNLSGTCKQSYALWVGDWGGGSMGYKFRAGIYGLFELEDGKEYIIPLKYFPRDYSKPNSSSRIVALDYLESIK